MAHPFKDFSMENDDKMHRLERKTLSDEINELPDYDAGGEDELARLPKYAGGEDEIELLPNMDDGRDRVNKKNIREVISGDYEASELDKNFKDIVKDVIKSTAPLDGIKTVVYLTQARMVFNVNFGYEVINRSTNYKLDDTVIKDIKDAFNEAITPEYIKENFGNTVLDVGHVAETMDDLTFEAYRAASYIGSKALVGACDAVEAGIDFIVGTGADLLGHHEVSEAVYNAKISEKISDYVDEIYKPDENLKIIGEASQKFGAIATEIGISVLSFNQSIIIGTLLAAGLGCIEAGEYISDRVDANGTYTSNELKVAVACGVASFVGNRLIVGIEAIDANIVKPKLVEELAKIDDSTAKNIVSKVVVTTVEAIKGGTDSLMFVASEEIVKPIAEKLEEIDDNKVDVNTIIKDVAIGAALSGGQYLISDFMNDYVNKFKTKCCKLTLAEKQVIKNETGWSDSTINYIEDLNQYKIYKEAGVQEAYIDGRLCLIKNIDLDYVDPKTGLTNRELMAKGRAPVDAKTGEKIELHHMMQDPDGPFIELLENSEHGDGNHKILHTSSDESWRNDPQKLRDYQKQRADHWKNRIGG